MPLAVSEALNDAKTRPSRPKEGSSEPGAPTVMAPAAQVPIPNKITSASRSTRPRLAAGTDHAAPARFQETCPGVRPRDT
jgi:hypothetical protein